MLGRGGVEWFQFGWELLSEKSCSFFVFFLFVVGLFVVVLVAVGGVFFFSWFGCWSGVLVIMSPGAFKEWLSVDSFFFLTLVGEGEECWLERGRVRAEVGRRV